MKKFWEPFRENKMKKIKFRTKMMRLWKKEHKESLEIPKIYFICKEKSEDKYIKYKKHHKVRDHCHYTGDTDAALSTSHLKYNVSTEFPIVLHNGSNDDYHFIKKEVAEKF